MTHTPPSEAAASSPSPYLSEAMLRAQANPDCAFSDAVQVLSREVLRLRAQCPPTEEVEKLRHAAREENRLHLHLSNIDTALAEAGQPHRQKGDELERIRDLAGERDAWRHQANRLGDDLNRIRALVPLADEQSPTFDVIRGELLRLMQRATAAEAKGGLTVQFSEFFGCDLDEARTAVAAIRDLGPELAKAGIQVGPRCSHAEAVAQLRGERDRWREKCEQAHQMVDEAARFEGAVVADLATHGFFSAGGLRGVRFAVQRVLAELARLRKESKRDRAAKQQALLDEIARLFPGKGPLLERVRAAAKPAPSAWRERFMRLRDGIKAQIAWCTLPGGAPFAGMHKEHAVLSCALTNADALLEEAAGESVSWVGGLSLFERRSCQEPKAEPLPFTGSDLLPSDATKRKRIVEELRQVVNRNSIEHACGDTPDFILAEAMLDAAFAFGRFTRSRDAHLGGRSFSNPGQPIDPSDPIGPKFAPATGQPRTEVPVGPDCSGALVGLGEAFRRNLANAVDCLPSDGHPIDATTVKIAIRNLHAAVAELARGVERIGGAK